LRRLGELEGARAAYQEAIAAIESSRPQTAESRRTSFASKYSGVYRELVSLLWQMHGASAAGEALGVAEAGRARALLDGLQAAGVEGRPHPRGAAEIQARLAPDEMLIEFVSLENQLLAFRGDRRRATRGGSSPEGRPTSRRGSAYFRQLVQEADDAATLRCRRARALYRDRLLAPLLDGRTVRRLDRRGGRPPARAALRRAGRSAARSWPSGSTLVSTPSAFDPGGGRAGGRGAGLIAVAAPPPRAGCRLLPSSLAEAQAAVGAGRRWRAASSTGAQATERRPARRGSRRGGHPALSRPTRCGRRRAPERSALLLRRRADGERRLPSRRRDLPP
jgi:hypothetical protein